MRAIVQGVDLQLAWDRYLRWEGEGGDARAMRATIAWLRDEFAAAARRGDRFGTARLVLLDAARVTDGAAALPALEHFVEERGLEDFPQAEQIALYEAEYGRATQRQRRRARLIARQLEALGWIEQQVAQPPRDNDSVAYWLNPLLAAPLQEAGLQTLGALRADIEGRGPRWHRRLRGIGATKAARIAAWLAAHQATLGSPPAASAPAGLVPGQRLSPPGSPAGQAVPALAVAVPRPAQTAPVQAGWAPPGALPSALPGAAGARSAATGPRLADASTAPLPEPPARPAPAATAAPAAAPAPVAPAAPIAPIPVAAPAAPAASAASATRPPPVVPLDRFAIPPALDGRHGSNRRPHAGMAAGIDNDREAIAAWLAKAGRSPHTHRAYHREAERLLLWCVVERRKALSSLDADDCLAYRAFLTDPQPRARWCVQPSPGRQSPLWRPFAGPLGAAGQRQAVAALSSLFAFLVDRHYLWTNPWRERPSVLPGPGPEQPADAAKPDAVHASYHAKPLATASAAPAPARRHRGGAARPLDAARSLSPTLWAAVLAAADALPPVGAHRRLGFALRWLYATGLRLSEAVGARLADLRHEPPSAGAPAAWWLRVPSAAAGRARELPLPDSLIDALRDYLVARGLDPDPLASAQRDAFVLGQATERGERASRLPLPGPIDARQGLRATTLARQLKQHFGACAAARAEAGDPDGARQLRAASAHWLRHTHARHLLANGLPLELAQRHLGHAARSTTAAYLVSERAPVRADWQAAWDATIAAQRDSAPAAGGETATLTAEDLA